MTRLFAKAARLIGISLIAANHVVQIPFLLVIVVCSRIPQLVEEFAMNFRFLMFIAHHVQINFSALPVISVRMTKYSYPASVKQQNRPPLVNVISKII